MKSFAHAKSVLLKVIVLLVGMWSLENATVPCWASSKTPALTFSPAATHVPVMQGTSANDLFTFTMGANFTGTISLSVTGLPGGVLASWSSDSVAMSAGSGTSTLTLSASPTATTNWFSFKVTATGDGLTTSNTYVVEVQQAPGMTMNVSQTSMGMPSMGTATVTLTAAPFGGLTVPAGAAGASATVISGLPAGIITSWGKPVMTASGAVSWTLTLLGSTSAVASSTILNVSTTLTSAGSGVAYTASRQIPLKISLTPPTLSVAPALTHVPLVQGAAVTDGFTLTSGGSFQGNVTLSLAGLPSGVTGSWSRSTVSLSSGTGTSTLTLAASGTAVTNWFPFTVTASGDGLTVSQKYVVEVEPSTGLKVQLSQSALSLQPQGTVTLSVTGIPINGVKLPAGAAGSSATILSGLPSGVTASWSGPTVTTAGAASWVLTLTADAGAGPGSHAVDLSVQVTDQNSGIVYDISQSFSLLISLLANVSIGDTPGIAISPTFMGLSHEWGDSQSFMGSSTTGVNLIYRQLLTNLTAYGSGPVNLRIGGNSTDSRKEPTPTTVKPFVELAKALGVHFELGVNLGSDNVSLAADQASAYLSQMPAGSVEALEIGNEPHLYNQNGLRQATYTVEDYFSDFNNWKEHILAVVPAGSKLIGPSWCTVYSKTCWAGTDLQTNVLSFASMEADALFAFSEHYYASSPANHPATDFLLTPGAATEGPLAAAPAALTSHANGLPFRMDEMNSVSDTGIHGISDSFGAALWSIDTMFEYANAGVDGVNWEASDGNYDNPFTFNSSTSKGLTTYTLSSINPLYYGLLLFQAATVNGTQLLPVSISTPANLKAWATIDKSGVPRLCHHQ